jgi:hypothetical protein
MKKTRFLFILLLVAGLVLRFTSCDSEKEADISFQSFSPASVYIDNNTIEKLIAFKDKISLNNLISGIPSYALNHGLKKDAALFNITGPFALIFITEEQYNKNKANLENAVVFARLFAFYHTEATVNSRYQISSKAGGTGRIILNNPTSKNVIIRMNGPTGEILGYVPPYIINMPLCVQAPDIYSLYPVITYYSPVTGELYSVIPTYASGELEGLPYVKLIALSTADAVVSWNLGGIINETDFNFTDVESIVRN